MGGFRGQKESSSSAHQMVSKRLVEYFLVYSCNPKKRKEPTKPKNDDDDLGHEDQNHPQNNHSNRNSRDNHESKDASSKHISAAKRDRMARASTRAVHLKVATDGGIIGNSQSSTSNGRSNDLERGEFGGDANARKGQGFLEDFEVTPLVTRKQIRGKNRKDNDNTLNYSNDSDVDSIMLAPSFRGMRIPATEDSGRLTETDDEGPNTDAENDTDGDDFSANDIEIKSAKKTVTMGIPVTPPRHKYNGDDSDTDLMTPSRVRADDALTPSRARAAMDSDSDEDQSSGDNVPNGDNDHSLSPPSPPKRDVQNVHLPRVNSMADNETDPLASEFYLEPINTAQYPLEDRSDCPLNPMISHFCFPQELNLTTEFQMPKIHYFVLTNDKGKKMYGTCLTVWETLEEDAIDMKEEWQGTKLAALFKNKSQIKTTESTDEDNVEVSLSYEVSTVYVPKVLCILSSWPYLHSFREYLAQLYRLATMTDLMEVPIEKYIVNICDEAPAPPPGLFEVRLKIFSSMLKFWGPPGGQPIAHVALPFKVLFECLDLNNVVFVWYALTLERKVLLVSSKYSLITTCAEILCSLLFPMEWSHLYVPFLPRFLSPMLDAPMPYLCGISRENFSHAVGDISDETIVVDLDQNLITMGSNAEPFPPLPLKRRSKLEKILQSNVGNVFWEARGLNREEIVDQDGEIILHSDELMKRADRVWNERLRGYDDVFNLAFKPDSEYLAGGESRGTFGDGKNNNFQQSTWDSVQEAFLRFHVTMLRDYKKFITTHNGMKTFKTKEFIASQRADHRFFLREFCLTQQFDCFLTKKMYEPGSPDILFFDQSITAKKNRSKMTLKKKETPFLMTAKAHRELRSVEVLQPMSDPDSGSNLMDQFYAGTPTKKRFMYKNWPDKFDPKLFTKPRPIPPAIAAEFARIDNVSKLLGHTNTSDTDDEDFCPGNSHPSIEVGTFTLFFAVYCKVVGAKFELLRNRHNETKQIASRIRKSVELEIEESETKSRSTDCGTGGVCSPWGSSSVTQTTITNESIGMLRPLHDSADATSWNAGVDTDVEAAQLIANRQLDLAFSVMEMMSLRGLPSDQDALKALMEGCGRCGSTNRATQLITMMKEQYLPVDSEVYSNYLTTFTVANELNPDAPIKSPLANVPVRKFDPNVIKVEATKHKWFSRTKKKSLSRSSSADNMKYEGSHSETSSTSGTSETSSTHNSPQKKMTHTRNVLLTTDSIERNLIMGECLLNDDLYNGITIDDKGDSCPKCSAFLSSEQLMMGWSFCEFTEYRTKCLHCQNEFIPRFVVKSNSPNFIGSQGAGSQLYCEFFSPWVIRRELHLATNGGEDMQAILDPSKRIDNSFNTKLWWNMVVLFRRQKLPFTFLLQGYFPGNLTV